MHCTVLSDLNQSTAGGGELDIRAVPLLPVAVGGRVDLHRLHPAPGGDQHGPLHRRHPPRHLPQHHDRNQV